MYFSTQLFIPGPLTFGQLVSGQEILCYNYLKIFADISDEWFVKWHGLYLRVYLRSFVDSVVLFFRFLCQLTLLQKIINFFLIP